ncbi:MAG: hypothetical protein J5706_07075 [Elusimicrobiales bacterium]|nr:hypothetical protein [Elusimicrobiales bacterium]
MVSYDNNTDYKKLMSESAAAGNYVQAAQYEQQRNAKIADMNAAGTNVNNYQMTYDYASYLNGNNNTSAAQQVAQATSPASAAWGQTGNGTTTMNNGNGNTVTNAGQGTLSYDPSTGRVIRTMPDGRSWYVDPDAGKYNQIYQEYYNTTGNDPRGLYTGSAAIGAGMMQSAATSNDAYIQQIMNLSNALANAQAPAYQAPDTSAQKAMLDQYLSQLGSIEYNPVDYDQYMSRAGTLDEYYQQAMDVLNPRYQSQYRDAYNKSANNLGKAGIFNSLAAQALMAQQQNAVTEALNADAAEMGQNLYQKALDRAYQAYQSAVQENQFGASFKQQNLTESGQLTMSYIGLLNDEAKNVNDYNMQAYLGKMQQYVNAIDGYYQAGALTSAEYENMMNAAKIELSKVEQQLTQAQIANTNADTDYIKAKTQAVLYELANPTNASGYGYGSGGSGYGYDYDDSPVPVQVDTGSGIYNNPARKAGDAGKLTATYKETANEVRQQVASGDTQDARTTLQNARAYLTTQQVDNLKNIIEDEESRQAANKKAAQKAYSAVSQNAKTPTGGIK